VESGFAQNNNNNNTNNIMSNLSSDILYSDKHPAMIYERLQNMVFNSKHVCVRLEMITSPITLWGTIRMNESGHFLVETSDQQSYAVFTLKQVTSMGNTAIWITPEQPPKPDLTKVDVGETALTATTAGPSRNTGLGHRVMA
jgi:hypothetical protein